MFEENHKYITQQQTNGDIMQTPNYSKIKYNQNLLFNYTQKLSQNKYFLYPYEDNYYSNNRILPDSELQKKISFSLNNNNNTYIDQKITPKNLTKKSEEIRKIDYNDQSYQFQENLKDKMIPESKFKKKVKLLYPQNLIHNRSYINTNKNTINSPIYKNYYSNFNVSPQKSNTNIIQKSLNNTIKKRIVVSKLTPSNNSDVRGFNYFDISNNLNNDNYKMVKNNTEGNTINYSPKIINPNNEDTKLNIIKLNNNESQIFIRCNSNDNINKNILVRKLPINTNEEN